MLSGSRSFFSVIKCDKIIEPPLFVRIKAFVLISFVNEKMFYGKVSVANQQALIGATNWLATLSLMLRLTGSAFVITGLWEGDEI